MGQKEAQRRYRERLKQNPERVKKETLKSAYRSAKYFIRECDEEERLNELESLINEKRASDESE